MDYYSLEAKANGKLFHEMTSSPAPCPLLFPSALLFPFFLLPIFSHFPICFLIFFFLDFPLLLFFFHLSYISFLSLTPLPATVLGFLAKAPPQSDGQAATAVMVLKDQALLGKIQNWDQNRKKEKELMFSNRTRDEERSIKEERSGHLLGSPHLPLSRCRPGALGVGEAWGRVTLPSSSPTRVPCFLVLLPVFRFLHEAIHKNGEN